MGSGSMPTSPHLTVLVADRKNCSDLAAPTDVPRPARMILLHKGLDVIG